MVEESFNVRLYDEVHASLLNSSAKLVECLVLRAPGPIAVRTFCEVRFVYLLQHTDQPQPHKLVFEAQDAQWPLLVRAGFLNIGSPRGLRSIPQPLQSRPLIPALRVEA